MPEFVDMFRKGQEIIYSIPDWKIRKMRKRIIIFLVITICLVVVKCSASAQTYTTYDNALYNNNIVVQLESMLPYNYTGNYVIFRSSDSQYVLAYGKDLENDFTGAVSTIIATYNFNSGYTYTYGTDNNFELNRSKIVTSNFDGNNVSHSVNYYNKDKQKQTIMLICVFLPLITAFNLRSVIKNDYV